VAMFGINVCILIGGTGKRKKNAIRVLTWEKFSVKRILS